MNRGEMWQRFVLAVLVVCIVGLIAVGVGFA